MLNPKLFEAYGDIYMKTTRWDAGYKKLLGDIKKIPAKVTVDLTMRNTGVLAGMKMIAALKASAKTPIPITFQANRAQMTAAVNLAMQQIRTMQRRSFGTIPIRADLRPWRTAMQSIAMDLYRVRAFANIPLGMSGFAAAHANLNLLQQHMRAVGGSANMGVGGFGGGGGGGRGAFSSMAGGMAMGLGLPFMMGSPAAAAGFAGAAGLKSSVKTASDLQSAFLELRRITGATAVEMDDFKSKLFDISTTQAGVSVEDLLEIAKTGARAGVTEKEGVGGLADFTKQTAMVKNAIPDMDTEQLSNSMLRVLNVFQLGTERVSGFGSALTKMDNISIASAKDILAITTGLSGTAASIGLTLPQVLALSAALKNAGLTNQLAASSFSQIFRLMAADSAKFAGAIGVDARSFGNAMRKDPMQALGMLIAKFKELNATDTLKAQEWLKELGFKGVRAAGSFQQLAATFKDVESFAKMASDETGNLNALTQANILNASKAQNAYILWTNAVTQLKDALGANLLPVLTDTLHLLTAVTKSLASGDWELLKGIGLLGVGGGMFDVDLKKKVEDLIGGALGWDMGANAAGAAPGAGAPALNALPAVKPGPAGLNINPIWKQAAQAAVEAAHPDVTGDEKEKLIFEHMAEVAKSAGDFVFAAKLMGEAANIQKDIAQKPHPLGGAINLADAAGIDRIVQDALTLKTAPPPDYLKRRPEDMDRNFSVSIFNNAQDLGKKIQTDILNGDIQKKQLTVQEQMNSKLQIIADNSRPIGGAALLGFGVAGP